MLRGVILALTVGGMACLRAEAVSAQPRLEASLSNQEISLDETVIYTIRIDWPKEEANYVFALPQLSLQNLTLERQGESEESVSRSAVQQTRKTFSIELRPLQSGEARISGFQLPYIDPKTQKGGSFTLPEQKITVRKPPLKFPIRVAAFAAIIPVAVLFLIRSKFWLQRQATKPKTHARPTPQEQAIERLKGLIAHPSDKSGRQRVYEWSTELRQFVAKYYDIGTEQLTEEKILEQLKAKGIERSETEVLQKLFTWFHEAKFTGTEMSESNLKHLQNELLHYLEGKRVLGHLPGG